MLLFKAAKVEKGSGQPNKVSAGQVTRQQLEEIAKLKMTDLNASSLEAAMKIIAGTARSAGIAIKD